MRTVVVAELTREFLEEIHFSKKGQRPSFVSEPMDEASVRIGLSDLWSRANEAMASAADGPDMIRRMTPLVEETRQLVRDYFDGELEAMMLGVIDTYVDHVVREISSEQQDPNDATQEI